MEGATVTRVDGGGGRGRPRVATAANTTHRMRGDVARSPALGIAKAIEDALDPARAPGRCRSLADMSAEEQAEMRALYERPEDEAP